MGVLAREVARRALLDFGVRSVELMLTTGCNLRCAYCYQHRGTPRTMAPEVLDAAIRQLVSSHLDRPSLSFFGGEPLLAAPLIRRALERVREWAPRRMAPDLEIVTNGTRLDEDLTRLLVSQNVFITLSFDGAAPAQDDRAGGSFEILDRLLVRLEQDHPTHFRERVVVKVTLTSRNIPFLSASFRYFLSRGVREVDLYPVLPDDAGWDARSRRELGRQLAEVVRLSVAEFQRSSRVPFRAFRGPAVPSITYGRRACGCGGRSRLFVDVDGAVAPCAMLAPSTLGAQSTRIRRVVKMLGGLHVTDADLSARLARREERARRLPFLGGPELRRGLRGPCATCGARPTCFVCPIAVGADRRVPAFHCDVNWLLARHRAAFLRSTRASAEERAGRPARVRSAAHHR